MMKSEHDEHYEFRDELVHRLVLDLMGPKGGPDEVLEDPPVTTYPVGALFPQGDVAEDPTERAADNNPDPAADVARREQRDGDRDDSGVALSNVRRPSAMGITFAVDRVAAPEVTVRVEAARYLPVDASGRATAAKAAERRSTEDTGERWMRQAVPARDVPVDVTVPGTKAVEILPHLLSLQIIVRNEDASGAVAVTVTLINTATAPKTGPQDESCFFQPRLTVTAPAGSGGLVERPVHGRSADPELDVSRLLHRHAPSFATGHGCAADWHWVAPPPNHLRADAGPCRIDAVHTELVPTYEVMLTDSNPDIDATSLGMKWLSTAPRDEIVPALLTLLSSYENWIEERRTDAERLGSSEFAELALLQIENCATALGRMRSGVELLRVDDDCLEAFRLANRAMDDQRTRAITIKEGEPGRPNTWRPFQIGFVLLCLDGIADPQHDDRQIADLLWFPTGGGKTEAYLGLIAFTVFLRRLRRRDCGGGVTVLMRYTLRLLTLQQFERATILICAMERIRLEAKNSARPLGSEKISIGMWVGQSATPNDLKTAQKSLQKLRNGQSVAKENPVQLRACPWCGSALDAHDYTVTLEPAAMVVACPDEDCDFHEGLPIHVVDQTVYQARPTLVIATVDKFALIPWEERTAALFNRNRPADDTPPPELIVQDELHLISGPLGTMTGLYETMIDLAADTPKVIASTATIRRAKQQGRALFHREVHQFPPTALDSRDSWFSREAPADRKATRRYVGLLTPSTSQATLLVRAYAALLHHAALIEGPGAVRDAYWTLVGYFNSLRLLAAAELQVRDDVHDRIALLAAQAETRTREINEPSELTSRIDASDIPKYLKDLERRHPHPDAVDVLLATNMISVGVDIDRLGLMAVMGQPQTTAEYIQATSRVGRSHPGLVVTLLNSARSRDRSHYENFTTYHSALYRQVESTSVTPFSPRARDRALHAVLVGLARLTIEAARPKSGAAKIDRFEDRLKDIRTAITWRAREIAPEHADDVDAELEEIIDDWRLLAETYPDTLVYEGWFGKRPALLVPFAEAEDGESFRTLTSLRDVDAESDLFEEK
ncbi:helicase-related protein [Streptomyces virginiae]|uniref:Helicase-related protein n=1 Tax=Streptomyces virginiae TaxID=1961 RepID=A0ABZ1TF27_STRVG|nr:helicase-related protein [Streptomyces virginiae]